MKAMGARELSPPCSVGSPTNVQFSDVSVLGCRFLFPTKGRKGRLNGPRTAAGMNGFDLNSARFRLFQLRRPLQGKSA
jgi:hypothetical protein